MTPKGGDLERKKMPVSERAKQFSPFSPLRGLEEALERKTRERVVRRELSEEQATALNASLSRLQAGWVVRVCYYDPAEQCYRTYTGAASAPDLCRRTLTVGERCIPLADLFSLGAVQGTD